MWRGKCSLPPLRRDVLLAFIESEDNIMNDFRFLGCFCQFNYPLHITICSIKLEFQTKHSPPRLTEVILLNQLNFFTG